MSFSSRMYCQAGPGRLPVPLENLENYAVEADPGAMLLICEG